MRKSSLVLMLLLVSAPAWAQMDTSPRRICASHVYKHITTATDTQLVAGVSGSKVCVCDYEFSFGGTGNAYLEYSTTGTCASPTQMTMAWYGAVNIGKAASNPYYRGLTTPASAQLCVNTSGAVSFDIAIYYDQGACP